jgi:ankyrin repeat protein
MGDRQAVVDELVGNSHGAIDVVRGILDRHPDLVSARSSWGESPLQAASQMGRKDILALLIERGAETDFHSAIVLGDLQRVREELSRDPDLAVRAGVHDLAPLYFAAAGDNLEMAELLLERGADVTQGSPAGSPIHAAVMWGGPELVTRYLEAGADPSARDHENRTARELADAVGRQDIAALL